MAVVVALERFQEPGGNRRRAAVAIRVVVRLAPAQPLWRVIGASVAGTSHAGAGVGCQDYHAGRVVDVAGESVAILALADGAGSAAASLFGARTAVEAAVRTLARCASRGSPEDLTLDLLRDAVTDARNGVFQAVDEFGHLASEYAATLLLAVASAQRTLVAHIGDGAIVVEDEELRVLSYPEQGEYANTTRFLTDDDALGAVRLAESGPAQRVALLSDGLQGLALEYATCSAYKPFFGPIFGHVAAADEPERVLCAELGAWLSSRAVSARTSDDTSLVVAVRRR